MDTSENWRHAKIPADIERQNEDVQIDTSQIWQPAQSPADL